MRRLKLCLIGTLALSAACGGGYEKTAAAPQGTVQPGPVREMRAGAAKRGEEDHDSDGIPDPTDRAPDEPLASTAGMTTTPVAAPQGASGQAAQREGSYLIYTATLTMAVYQVEGSLGQVEQIGKDVGGYLAVRQDRSITIRVPRAKFEEAIKKIESTGDVVHRDISAQDVTDEFMDTEVRLKNARAMRDRLQDLLQKAAVKEALEIEKELGRITQDIERMEGRLKLLKDKIAFSTITVNFDARASSLKTMPIRLPFAWLPTLGLPSLLRLNETK